MNYSSKERRPYLSIVIFISLLFFSFQNIPQAQHQNILISDNLNEYEPNEPSVVVNPSNTNEILVGSNNDNYFYSTDAGHTWTHRVLHSSHTVLCDPCVLVDGHSQFYYCHLVYNISGVVCQKAESIGAEFNNGTFVTRDITKDNDKEWAVYDRERDIIYLTWAEFDVHGSMNPSHRSRILFTKSTDQGETWTTPVIISDIDGNAAGGNYSDHGPMPEYGPNGEVYVVWWGPQGLMMDISTDFGETWLQHDINVLGEHITWLPDIPGIAVAPSFLVIKCDRSNGSGRGTLYINWCDQTNGTSDTDVWLIKSNDGGLTWENRIRVNNDPASPSKHQFYSWMDIDQTNGHIYIMFYDRRNYSGNQTDVYLAYSSGGSRFSNTKISESPFTPVNSSPFGHYNALSVHNGVVRPVWTRQNNGRLQLMTAIVDVSAITGITELETENIPLDFGISSVFPNPFNPSAKVIYHINEPGDVKLILFDALGRKIKDLFSSYQTPGDYEYELVSGDIASGVYYITLETNNNFNSKKIMCLK